MFDYVKNRYNPNPDMALQGDLDNNCLYIKYLDAPRMAIPNSLEEFLASHKSKFWYNLKRLEKMYGNEVGDLSFEVIKDEERLGVFLDQVFRLFKERWKDDYVSSPWKCRAGFEEYKNAMVALAKSGNGFLAVLYGENNKLLSYGYCLVEEGTVYFYQHTTVTDQKYRRYSLGKVLIHNLLKYLIIEKKNKFFDFMSGEQTYKREWAKDTRAIYIKVDGRTVSSFVRYYLLKFRLYIQFNELFRGKVKTILKIKDDLFLRC